MTTPTRKQLVVQTLKSLAKARTKALFRIKALKRQRKDVTELEKTAIRELESIERKMTWEVNNNGKALGDKS